MQDLTKNAGNAASAIIEKAKNPIGTHPVSTLIPYIKAICSQYGIKPNTPLGIRIARNELQNCVKRN